MTGAFGPALALRSRRMNGVVAAGHPLTADAGAQILRAGGNAVDAALAAMAVSFVAEPQLTGLGAGGFMLVAEPGEAPALLDFFVSTSGLGADLAQRAPLVAAEVLFGSVAQVFHVGPSSCGVYGTPAGMCEAHRRYATMPLAELVARGARHARDGVEVNAQQAYIFDLLAPLFEASDEAREKYWVGERVAREGDVLRNPELADHARAPRGGGRGAVLRRRHRRGGGRAGDRGRRHAHARGPRRLRGDPARADPASATAATTSSPTRRRRPAGS